MGVLEDYSNQASGYDRTRSASPSVLAPLRAALAGAPGPRLADIGGGTGNYALALTQEGWEPVVIDRSSAMLAYAREKGLATLYADAQRLPLDDASFDAAMLVSMLHHVEDPPAVLTEAKRIVRAGGRLAVMLYTREDVEDLWFLELFPSTHAWMELTHPHLADMLAQLPGARHHPVPFEDLKDASLAALASHPEKVLEERWRTQTSYFERLQRQGRGDEYVRVRDDALHQAASRSARAACSSSRTSAIAASSSRSLRERMRATSERRSYARIARSTISPSLTCASAACERKIDATSASRSTFICWREAAIEEAYRSPRTRLSTTDLRVMSSLKGGRVG